MGETKDELQAALDKEREYTRKVNDRYERMREQLMELQRQREDFISKSEHDKIVEDYERRLSEFNSQQPKVHNERGAGRKRIASKEIAARVLELTKQGLSQAKIAAKLSCELNIMIGRTTVGEIVRGNYTPSDGK